MIVSIEEFVVLMCEVEIEDLIDYGDLFYVEDELCQLVCNQICEIVNWVEW